MLHFGMVTDPAAQQSYTAGLVEESDRLCRLVENVLQYARLENQNRQFATSQIQVDRLLKEGLTRSLKRAQAAQMRLNLNIGRKAADQMVTTSTDLIDQILFNLVDNACKYASTGRRPQIDIDANVDSRWLRIEVRDFGPGIDTKQLRRLFQPFSRSSDETAGTAAGVGLGLSLSSQLAKLLGGELVYSPAEPGSRFTVKIRI
jgi:signal transduction histidine kinase